MSGAMRISKYIQSISRLCRTDDEFSMLSILAMHEDEEFSESLAILFEKSSRENRDLICWFINEDHIRNWNMAFKVYFLHRFHSDVLSEKVA